MEVTSWILVKAPRAENAMLVCMSVHMSRSRGVESVAPQVTCQAHAGPGRFQCQLRPLGCYPGTLSLAKSSRSRIPSNLLPPVLTVGENFPSAKYFCTAETLRRSSYPCPSLQTGNLSSQPGSPPLPAMLMHSGLKKGPASPCAPAALVLGSLPQPPSQESLGTMCADF